MSEQNYESLHTIAALLVCVEPGDPADIPAILEELERFSASAEQGGLDLGVQLAVTDMFAAVRNAIDEGLGDNELAKLHRQVEEVLSLVADLDTRGTSVTQAAAALAEERSGDSADEVLPEETDEELLGEFVNECGDALQGAEGALLELEQDPEQSEALNTVFRAFHTVKGTSAFLGLSKMSEFAHQAENLLSRMRDGEIRCEGHFADLALRSVDMLRSCAELVANIAPGQVVPLPQGIDALKHELTESDSTSEPAPAKPAPRRALDIPLDSEPVAPPPTTEVTAPTNGAATAPATEPRAKANKSGERSAESSVRVRTDRLDRLIDMVGELVIAQSMVSQDEDVAEGRHPTLTRKITHAGKIVRELQDLSMSLRMVPMRSTFQKMSRIARDAARRTGKQVRFVTEGEDTEIDRNMVDVVGDPLVHMVRNAVDHGLETPEQRAQAGKSTEGSVWLRAYHSGGNVVIELQEDGRGLDRERIVAKAIENGVIESDRGLTDQDVYQLIFMPGFSTAAELSELSGRGVGLDVVRRNIEELEGNVDVSSKPGQGTTFSLRLPLTLAITDGMLVRVGRQNFIIPTVAIKMSLRPKRDDIVSVEGRGEMLRLRGEVMPLFRLHEILGVPDAVTDPCKALL
ncbi:MAG: chemotaxis protein CheA, partial [Planctomycetes bacterium]|nr:chemotaxis protein CheA [Planctomycetota bacterium]